MMVEPLLAASGHADVRNWYKQHGSPKTSPSPQTLKALTCSTDGIILWEVQISTRKPESQYKVWRPAQSSLVSWTQHLVHTSATKQASLLKMCALFHLCLQAGLNTDDGHGTLNYRGANAGKCTYVHSQWKMLSCASVFKTQSMQEASSVFVHVSIPWLGSCKFGAPTSCPAPLTTSSASCALIRSKCSHMPIRAAPDKPPGCGLTSTQTKKKKEQTHVEEAQTLLLMINT